MKIRIANNSIRFRLKQPEVQHFSEQKSITEVLSLRATPTEQLRFTLTMVGDNRFSVTYSGHAITVLIPGKTARQWTSPELVGIEEDINVENGKSILILLEKDFACLDKAEKENEGAYPNPKANC